MKTFTFLLLFFTFSFAQGQNYSPLIEPGKQTLFFYDCNFCPTNMAWYNQLYFEGDTTVNGTVYNKLMAKAYPYSTISFGDTTVYLAALLREDIQNQTIYKFAGLPHDSVYGSEYMSEVLLWDFNLAVGDSTKIFEVNDGWKNRLTIDRIDSISLSDGTVVRQFVSAPGPNYVERVLFTEKIIWSIFLIETKYPSMDPEPKCAWTGFSKNLYSDGSGWACNFFNYIGLEEQMLAQSSLYPNPASSLIIFNAPLSGELEIHSILGKLVLRIDIRKNQQKSISVADLPEGMYVWSFYTKIGNQSGKLIIKK